MMDTRVEPSVTQATRKRRQPMRWRRYLGSVAAILVIGAAGWMMFAPDPVPAELATVTEGPLQVSIDNQGQVRAHEKYVIAAPVAAELQRITLRDGDPVRKDQVLATLNPLPMDARQTEEARARLDAARALAEDAVVQTQQAGSRLQLAASERARIEKLMRENFVSAQAGERAFSEEKVARAEVEAARSRVRAAEADVKAAQAALVAVGLPSSAGIRQLQLSSPVEGYALKVHEKSQRTVTAGTPLVTVGDPGRYEIVVDVLSTDAVRIRPGNTMLLEGWGGGKILRARVRLVEPVAFTKISVLGVEEQRVNIIADPIDELGPLGDGYRIEARIVIWADDKVVKVPGCSLFRAGDSWHVFVVEGGRAREREVRVGQRNQDEVQLLAGTAADIRPDTKIIRYPGNQLKDGIRIKPSNER